jgi:hypothetical protein
MVREVRGLQRIVIGPDQYGRGKELQISRTDSTIAYVAARKVGKWSLARLLHKMGDPFGRSWVPVRVDNRDVYYVKVSDLVTKMSIEKKDLLGKSVEEIGKRIEAWKSDKIPLLRDVGRWTPDLLASIADDLKADIEQMGEEEVKAKWGEQVRQYGAYLYKGEKPTAPEVKMWLAPASNVQTWLAS